MKAADNGRLKTVDIMISKMTLNEMTKIIQDDMNIIEYCSSMGFVDLASKLRFKMVFDSLWIFSIIK